MWKQFWFQICVFTSLFCEPYWTEGSPLNSCTLNRCLTRDDGVTLFNLDWQVDAALKKCSPPSQGRCVPCPNGSHATLQTSWEPCLPCSVRTSGQPGSTFCTQGKVQQRSPGFCTYRKGISIRQTQLRLELPILVYGFPQKKVKEIHVRDAEAKCGRAFVTSTNVQPSLDQFSTASYTFQLENDGELPVIVSDWKFDSWIAVPGQTGTLPTQVLLPGVARNVTVTIQGTSLPVSNRNKVDEEHVETRIKFTFRQLFSNPGVTEARSQTVVHTFQVRVTKNYIRTVPDVVTVTALSDDEPFDLTVGIVSSGNERLEAVFELTGEGNWMSINNPKVGVIDSTCGQDNRSWYRSFKISPRGLAPGKYQMIARASVGTSSLPGSVSIAVIQYAKCLVNLEITDGGKVRAEHTVWHRAPFMNRNPEGLTSRRLSEEGYETQWIEDERETAPLLISPPQDLRSLQDSTNGAIEFELGSVELFFQPRDEFGFVTSQPPKADGLSSDLFFQVNWNRISPLDKPDQGEVIVSSETQGEWSTKLDVRYTGEYEVQIQMLDDSGNLVHIAGSPAVISVVERRCPGVAYAPDESGKQCTCAGGYGMGSAQSLASPHVDCSPCPPGTYSPAGSVVCLPCERGFVQFQEAQSSCERCPRGFEPNSAASCRKCGENQVSNAHTDYVCQPCSPRERVVGQRCYCRPEYYVNPKVPRNNDSRCTICPTGAFCAFASSANLLPLHGYWQLPWAQTQFRRCNHMDACQGIDMSDELLQQMANKVVELQNRSAVLDNRHLQAEPDLLEAPVTTLVSALNISIACADGHGGPFCSDCLSGYFPAGDGLCRACSSAWRTILLLAFSSFVFLGLLVGLVYNSLSSEHSGRTDAAVTILKITASHLQVLGMAQRLHTEWPLWMRELYDAFDAATNAGSLDMHCVSYFTSQGSSFSDVFYHSAIGFMFAPLVVTVLALVLWKVAYAHVLPCKACALPPPSDDGTRQGHVLGHSVSVCVMVTVTVFLFLTQPFLTKTGLSFFACSPDVMGKSFLQAAVSVECNSEKHRSMLWVGYVISLLYALGIPLLVLTVLFGAVVKRWPWPVAWSIDSVQDKARLKADDVIAYNFLHRSFRPKYFYWEAVVMLRKAAFAIVAVVPVQLDVQILFGTVIAAVAIALHLLVNPYKSAKHLTYGDYRSEANFKLGEGSPGSPEIDSHDDGIVRGPFRRFAHRYISFYVNLNRMELNSLMIIVSTFWVAELISVEGIGSGVQVGASALLLLANLLFFLNAAWSLFREGMKLRVLKKPKRTKSEQRTSSNYLFSEQVNKHSIVEKEYVDEGSLHDDGVGVVLTST